MKLVNDQSCSWIKDLPKRTNIKILKKILIESEFSFLKKGKIYPLNEIYLKVQSLYPELCDDNDIRIKDGYTIKWKWYIRFALDQLKKKNKSQNYEMIPIV